MGIVKQALTDDELWCVTDIHDAGLYSHGTGVSLKKLKPILTDYQLIAARTYAFFGRMWSELPRPFQVQETALIQQGARNGRQLSAAWQHQ